MAYGSSAHAKLEKRAWVEEWTLEREWKLVFEMSGLSHPPDRAARARGATQG